MSLSSVDEAGFEWLMHRGQSDTSGFGLGQRGVGPVLNQEHEEADYRERFNARAIASWPRIVMMKKAARDGTYGPWVDWEIMSAGQR